MNAHRDKPLLAVHELRKHFPITRGLFRRTVGYTKAVDGVSFALRHGEILSLVGESGCGKTTTGRCVMRAVEPTSGSVIYGFSDGIETDIQKLSKAELKKAWMKMGMVFQDPFSSLNPRMTVLEIVGEPFIAYRLVRSRAELEDRVADLLQRVRLDPNYMKRYPHAFSGGQRQRIAIARALALNPEFVVADEPVSALDVSVQAQILELLRDLRDAYSLTYLFIAHNLAVVEYISDRVGVMYVGRIAELGRNRDVFSQPRHPYTEALLSAIPKLDVEGEQKRRVVLQGDVADPSNPPSGCYFHPRCRYAQPICSKETPALEPVAGTMDDAHISACHFRDDLQLVGISREEERRVYRVPGIDHG